MSIELIADLVVKEADEREKLKAFHPDNAARIYQVLMEVSSCIGEKMAKIRRAGRKDG